MTHTGDKLTDRFGFGRCECGKIRFRTRKAAKAAIRRMNAQGLRSGHLYAYTCGDWFHVGHQPSLITRGVISRDEFDPGRRAERGGQA